MNRSFLVLRKSVSYKCFKAGHYQNIWIYTRRRTILHNNGLCDLITSPALEPLKKDPRTVGVTALEADSIVLIPAVPTICTHGLRQQAKALSLWKVVIASIPVNRTERLDGWSRSATVID
jgi:hypothetical protein